jgi:hypothetical protein
MGWLKKKLKAAWRAVKGAVRVVVRAALTLFVGIFLGIPDLVLGFLLPEKKLRIQVFILVDPATGLPVATKDLVYKSIDRAKTIFKDRFNVKLTSYSPEIVQMIDVGVPAAALNVHCNGAGFLEELYREAGEFFNSHLAGWNAIPISLTFPVTVFIVADVHNKGGCSPGGPLTDYVTVDLGGLNNPTFSTMAHELGHACSLWHSFGKSNLMWSDGDRGDTVHWWQRNLARTSRHILWW